MRLRSLALAAVISLLGASSLLAARDPGLAQAIALLERGDVEGAVSALDPVVRRLSRDPQAKAELAQAYLHLGIAHSLLNAEYTARGALREALKLDPGLTLDPDRWPPKVQRLFAEVRAAAPASAPASAPSAAAAAASAPGATTGGDDEAFLAFARKAEQTVAAGDASFLNAAMDYDTLLDSSMRGLPASPELTGRFRLGITANGLGTALVEMLKRDGGTWKFIQVRRGSGPPIALFRWLLPNEGLLYQKLALRRDPTGAVRVVDSYWFNSEWVSALARRSWLDALAAAGATAGLQLSGFDADYVGCRDEVSDIQKLRGEHRFQAALEKLLKLPASVQSLNISLTARLEIAKEVDDARYSEAIDALARKASTEPELNLQLQQIYWSRKQFALALAAFDRFRQAVGADAYLDVMRGHALYNRADAPDFAGAKQAYQQAIARDAFLPQPHEALLRISLGERNYAETARLLTNYEPYAAKGAIDKLIASQEFAGFVASNEYREWQRTHPAGPRSAPAEASAPSAPAAPRPAAPAAPSATPVAPQLPTESWKLYRVDPTTGALVPLERIKAKGERRDGWSQYCYLPGAKSPAAYRRSEPLVFAVRVESAPKDLQGMATLGWSVEPLFVSNEGRRYSTDSLKKSTLIPLDVTAYGAIVAGVNPKKKDYVGQAYLLRPKAPLAPGEYALLYYAGFGRGCSGDESAFSIVE